MPSPESPLKIMLLGLNHFPYGLAETQRAILLSKAFMMLPAEVTVVSKMNVTASQKNLCAKGSYDGISYIFYNGKQTKSPFKKVLQKILGFVREIFIIRRLRRKYQVKIAFVSTNKITVLLKFRILSRLIGFKIILNYVEYYSAIPVSSKVKRFLHQLFDKYAPKLSDGIIPISNFLSTKLKEIKYANPILTIPAICEPERFNIPLIPNTDKYFCYCGSTNYYEVIQFVINAFTGISNKQNYKLHLVVSGNAELIGTIERELQEANLSSEIKILSHLPEKDYNAVLKNASALLIPLRDTLQDIARFPHKIGEYTATENPIISMNLGEIARFFEDNQNALLCDQFNEKLFRQKMKYVIRNPKKAELIGKAGKEVCLKHFVYRNYVKSLYAFFNDL